MHVKAPKGLVQDSSSLFRRRSRNYYYIARLYVRRYLVQVLICVLIIGTHVMLMDSPTIERFEFIALDRFFKTRPALSTFSDIAIIEIAEDSLDTLGRWPWPRHYHAAVTHLLTEWGAKAVIFDVLFSEKSDTFNDSALGDRVEASGNVYLPVVLEKKKEGMVWIRALPEFEKAARGLGHINVFPDRDGIIRRIRPFIESQGEVFPYLPLKAAYDYQEEPVPSQGALPFPTDEEGNLIINWAGRWAETFQHYSFLDVFRSFEALKNGKKPVIAPEVFKNKICLIGLTAIGHTDIRPNPLEPAYPSVGIHANVINSILTDQFVREAPRAVNIAVLVVAGLIASVLFVVFRNLLSFVTGLLSSAVWVGVAFYVFLEHGTWLHAVNPVLLVFSLFAFSALYSLIIGRKEQVRLFELAIRDGLTGLFVIRHFRELLNRGVAEARIGRWPISLVIIDIDHFKKVNDTHGHHAGDAVLVQTADILKGDQHSMALPKKAVTVGRYGGEEFIIMLKNCDLKQAAFSVAETLRKMVEAHEYRWKGQKIPVTVSLGVATLHPGENIPDMMALRADAALYRAKEEGRNRVCLENSDNPPASSSGAGNLPTAPRLR